MMPSVGWLVTWISCALFGLYVIGFYVISSPSDDWNVMIDGLFVPDRFAGAHWAFVAHCLGGGVLMILGPFQLLDTWKFYPRLHRFVGWVFLVMSLLASVGGLLFIGWAGTVAGGLMNVGSSLYGIFMLICTLQTWLTAGSPKFVEQHREWAWRLYSLAIGAWLFRMEYGVWTGFLGRTFGSRLDYSGPFDKVMYFLFWVPNLLVVEYLIWRRKRNILLKKEQEGGQKSTKRNVFVFRLGSVLLLAMTIIVSWAYWIDGMQGRIGPWMEQRRALRNGTWTGDVCLVMGKTICVL
mmetsp:Transcript_25767/g.59874  ORF Transcript_25767/g.59874 Transcript_25767/m.59874 type:complete len:294 (+) Transcript_25767:1-882(+)